MRRTFNIYQLLLPSLIGLYCSCMTKPTDNGSHLDHLELEFDIGKHSLNSVSRMKNAMGASVSETNSNSEIDSARVFMAFDNKRKKTRRRRSLRRTPANLLEISHKNMIDSKTEYSDWMGLHFQKPRQDPPDFMVKLFHLLSAIHSHRLKNTVVTSFVNINLQEHGSHGIEKKYTLAFNGTSTHSKENADHAELRIFFTSYSPKEVADTSEECLHQVKIYELRVQSPKLLSRTLIFSKIKPIQPNAWNAFDLTSSIQMWDTSYLRVIEVTVEPFAFQKGTNRSGRHETQRDKIEVPKHCILDAETDPRDHRDPILVVFSRKLKGEGRSRDSSVRTKRETSLVQEELVNIYDSSETGGKRLTSFNNKESIDTNSQFTNQSLHTPFSSTTLRHKTKYKPWIRFIKETLQKNGNDSSFNDSSKYLQRDKKPGIQRIQQSLNAGVGSIDEQGAAVVWTHRIRREIRSERLRHRRHSSLSRRSKRRYRNSCRRKELYVDFKEIKWNDYILFPSGYQAFECTGHCYIPMGLHLRPTKHAIIQTLYHMSQPRLASRACCVPTRLAPISVLYMDDNRNIKYEYTYDDMVAAECDCR